MIRESITALEIAQDVRASLGRERVDLVLKNCRMINVYSNEIHPADLAILRGHIVAIRENFNGPSIRTLDVSGCFAGPALVGNIFDDAKTLRDHETVFSFADAKRGIRNGKTVFLDPKTGVPQLTEILRDLRRGGIDTSNLCFNVCSKEGPHPIQVALESGFSAPEAFQLGALNPATHFCVDDVVGSLAPGRRADIVLFGDLKNFCPSMTFAHGQEVIRS